MKTKKLRTTLISILVLCCLALAFLFAACGKEERTQEQQPSDNSGVEEEITADEVPPFGKFYSLQTDFDNGWLSHSDLETIAHGHSAKKLSAASEDVIKEAYAQLLINYGDNATKDDVFIDYYYGTFNSCAVVMMSDRCYDYADVISEIVIDGVTFVYGNSNVATVYKA